MLIIYKENKRLRMKKRMVKRSCHRVNSLRAVILLLTLLIIVLILGYMVQPFFIINIKISEYASISIFGVIAFSKFPSIFKLGVSTHINRSYDY